MNITLKQIKAFIAVAQHKSFAEASYKLNLSQPALSITIKNLEQILGGSLMARSTRTLVLTPEGEVFFPIAKRLLNDWDDAFNDVSNMFSLKRGKLNIAAMPYFSASQLPNILTEYYKHFPNITVSLHDVVNESVIQSVRLARAELGICFDPGKNDDLEFIELFSEKFIAIVPGDSPLASYSKINWKDMLNYPFLTLQNPASIREDILAIVKAKGIPFSVHIEAHQITTIGEMVATGLGVSVVPESSTKQMTKMGAVCLPLNNSLKTRKVGIVYRHRYELSVAASKMKKTIISYYAEKK